MRHPSDCTPHRRFSAALAAPAEKEAPVPATPVTPYGTPWRKLTLRLTVQNHGPREERPLQNGPAVRFHGDAGPRSAGRWSHGRAFTMALEQITLKPGESRTFEAVWEQKDNAGKDVARGTTGSRASSPPVRDTRGSVEVDQRGRREVTHGRPAAGAPAIPGRQPGNALRGKPLRGMALVAAGLLQSPCSLDRKHACWYDVSKRLLSACGGLWVLKSAGG